MEYKEFRLQELLRNLNVTLLAARGVLINKMCMLVRVLCVTTTKRRHRQASSTLEAPTFQDYKHERKNIVG